LRPIRSSDAAHAQFDEDAFVHPQAVAGIRAPETIRGELYKTDKQLPHELYARLLADNIPIGNVL
jgi:hypothetical protein